jgi:hypothetical protein
LARYKNSLRGKSHGTTASGYIRDENGLLKIHEEQAKIVRRIFKLSGEGTGVYTISKTLNLESIPTKFNNYSDEFKRRDKCTNQYTYFRKGYVRLRGNVVHLLQYKLPFGFDDTKALVNSIIKKKSIQHNYRKDTKGGYFLIKIDYKGFDERITFRADWNALK